MKYEMGDVVEFPFNKNDEKTVEYRAMCPHCGCDDWQCGSEQCGQYQLIGSGNCQSSKTNNL
jgi:hypothetical protein